MSCGVRVVYGVCCVVDLTMFVGGSCIGCGSCVFVVCHRRPASHRRQTLPEARVCLVGARGAHVFVRSLVALVAAVGAAVGGSASGAIVVATIVGRSAPSSLSLCRLLN